MGNQYRPDIDGLRAVAVALVVAFHAAPGAVPGGFIGVDVFFVISGYLITELILDQQAAKRFSVKSFYLRRARRILPALAVVLAGTLIVGWLVLPPAPFGNLGLHTAAGALFFPNFVYWSEAGYFDVAAKTKPLLHLWSLGVEGQFYLVWPTLLILVRRWKLRMDVVLYIISALSLIGSSIQAFHDPAAAFYSPLSRLWELSTGGILAATRVKFRYLSQILSSAGLILILGAAFVLKSASPFPGLLAIIPVSGAALVIAGHSRILSRRPLVALGLISYPLYLWHWPLLSFAVIRNIDTPIAKAIIVATSIILAWVTTRYVEFPIRFGRLRANGAAIAAGGIVTVALGAFVIFFSGGLPLGYPAEIRPVLATMNYKFQEAGRYGRCWLTQGKPFGSYAAECRDGDILIWGDSFSAWLGTGLPKPYAQFSRNGCLPLLSGDDDPCGTSNALIADEIVKLKPRRVLLFGAWLFRDINDPRSSPAFNTALKPMLEQTLRVLRSSVDDVILLGPSPSWWPLSLPSVVFNFWSQFGKLPDRLKIASLNDYRLADLAMRDVAERQHARFISIFEAFCDMSGCLTHTPKSQSELLIWDHGHLTIDGAAYVVRKLGLAQVERAYAK